MVIPGYQTVGKKQSNTVSSSLFVGGNPSDIFLSSPTISRTALLPVPCAALTSMNMINPPIRITKPDARQRWHLADDFANLMADVLSNGPGPTGIQPRWLCEVRAMRKMGENCGQKLLENRRASESGSLQCAVTKSRTTINHILPKIDHMLTKIDHYELLIHLHWSFLYEWDIHICNHTWRQITSNVWQPGWCLSSHGFPINHDWPLWLDVTSHWVVTFIHRYTSHAIIKWISIFSHQPGMSHIASDMKGIWTICKTWRETIVISHGIIVNTNITFLVESNGRSSS